MLSAAQMQQQQQQGPGTPGTGGPPMIMQQPGPPPSRPGTMQPPDQAKEKLFMSVYEFLASNNAPKAAEALKSEMSATFPNAKWGTPGDPILNNLSTWWCIFYDLYCAAPERRNDPEIYASSMEAKYFHDLGYVPNSFSPMMNGMHPQFGGPSPMMGPDGMIAGFPGRFASRPGPPVHPMQAAQFSMYDPRMQAAAQQQRAAMAPGRGVQPPAPGGFPGMRPGGMPPQAMYRGPFMDPSGAFPPGMSMAPNGAVGPMGGMASPGGMPGGADGRYMMMPASSTAMQQFGMGPQPGPSSEGMVVGMPPGGPPSHPAQPPSAHTPVGNGPASAGGGPGTSGTPHSVGSGGGGGSMAGLLNGSDMKQSPAGTPRGNGGTPGPVGGPGSAAPGSVHSSGGVGSVPPPGSHQELVMKQEPMDTTGPAGDGREDTASEISKIKQSLIEDFSPKQEEVSGQGYY